MGRLPHAFSDWPGWLIFKGTGLSNQLQNLLKNTLHFSFQQWLQKGPNPSQQCSDMVPLCSPWERFHVLVFPSWRHFCGTSMCFWQRFLFRFLAHLQACAALKSLCCGKAIKLLWLSALSHFCTGGIAQCSFGDALMLDWLWILFFFFPWWQITLPQDTACVRQ